MDDTHTPAADTVPPLEAATVPPPDPADGLLDELEAADPADAPDLADRLAEHLADGLEPAEPGEAR